MVFSLKTSGRKFRLKSRILTITQAFAAAVVIGTLLLMLPVSKSGEGSAEPLTALFTATSAVCVTGLTVVDTATYWTFFGRCVILLLIQTGGLGVMMIGALVALAVGRRITVGQRLLISTSLNLDDISGIIRLAKRILAGAAFFEGMGDLVLTLRFANEYGLAKAAERGIFLSVSAFCNAGFDNLGKGGAFASVIPYKSDPAVLLTLSALVITGGIGFYVWNDLAEMSKGHKRTLSLHTKIVLCTTAVLLAVGTVGFFFFESDGVMAGESFMQRLLQSFFQAVTVRTAGFDHVGQGELASTSKALSVLLMLIGGSPGSTAGGIKTTTAAVLAMAAINALRGKKRLEAYGRTIPQKAVYDANCLFILAGMAAITGAFALAALERAAFGDAFFETISAIATVGLSVGITPSLGAASRLLLSFLMFLGRVGIVTVGMAALTRGSRDDNDIRLPDGRVIIG